MIPLNMLTPICMFRYRYGNVESYSIEQIWLAAQTVTGPVKRAKPAQKLRPRSAFACPGSGQAMGGKRARGQLMRPYRLPNAWRADRPDPWRPDRPDASCHGCARSRRGGARLTFLSAPRFR